MSTPDTECKEKIINDPRVKPFWDKIPYTMSKILEHPEGVTIINYLNDEISELITSHQDCISSRDTYWKERVEHEGQRVANEICKQIRVGKQYTEAELIYIFCKYTQPIRKLSIDVTPTPITNEDN